MNKNILFLHSHEWKKYTRNLLTSLQTNHECEITIASGQEEKHHYRHLRAAGAVQFFLPDLRKAMAFETSPKGIADMERLVHDCEKAAGKSASRIILSAEREFGRAYSRGFFYWPSNQTMNFALHDSDRPKRMLLRLFAWVNKIFENRPINLVLTHSTSEATSLTAWFLCQLKGIPYYCARYSKIASKQIFWTDDYNMYNTEADALYLKKFAAKVQPTLESLKEVHSFRETPQIVDYINQTWEQFNKNSLLRKIPVLADSLRTELRYYRKGCKGRKPTTFFAKTIETVRIHVSRRRHAKYFRTYTPDELTTMKYLYFPMHKEPELMLNFESPVWHDQKNLIRYISAMLPTGYRLLIREHRFNWGRRHTAYLDYLHKLPGVTLINPLDQQFTYIRNADLVITDNGSTGWEGLLLKRPVITLEKTLYDAPGLTRQVFAPRELDKAILDSLVAVPIPNDEYDRRLALRIDAEHETSVTQEKFLADPEVAIRWLSHLMEQKDKLTNN